jgi:succinoglycan biosynthesis transport protein ExoP
VTRSSSIHLERPSGLGPALDVWARRKWLALLVFSASFGAIASVAVSLPDLYRSTATVLVEREQVSEAFIRPSVTAELETRIQLIREQVMSRARLTDLIDRLDLYPEWRRKVPLDAVIDRMRRDIQLELKGVEQPMSGRSATIAFAISYLGREPHTVANVANALAALYVKENTKIREGQAVRTADFLRSQLQGIKRELDAQERRTSAFRLTHAGELPQQVEANLASLERLNTQLRLNGENQLRAMDRRDRLERELAQQASVLPSGSEPSSDAQRVATLNKELASLKGRFTDNHPDIIRLRFEVEALEQQISHGRAAAPPAAKTWDSNLALNNVETELRSLKEEEHALRQAIGAYEQRVENTPKRQQDLQELSRDYETTKERYDTLLKRYEEAQLAETLEQGQKVEQFRILDSAIPPREPAAPSRLRILLMGFIFAIGLAAGAVLAAEKLNTSFHTFDDLREAVSLPTLVRVPLILSAADTRRRRWRRAFAVISAAAGLMLVVAGSHFFALGNEHLVRLMERGRL